MWYKQSNQTIKWKDHIKWKNYTNRLERMLETGEDIPEEKIDLLLELAKNAYGNTGDLQQAVDRAFEIRRKWKSLQRKKRKEQQIPEEPAIDTPDVELSKDLSAAIQNIVSKIATSEHIAQADKVIIKISKDTGIVQFEGSERVRKALTEWKYPRDYSGESFEGYYVILSRNRDSGTLENSNFEKALELLGGEDADAGVIVASSGHWAVGWIEELLVSKNAPEKVAIAETIEESLDKYPLLDEEDWSRREYEEMSELTNDVVLDILRDIENKYDADTSIFPTEKKEKLHQIVFDNIDGHGGQHFDEDELFKEALVIFKEELFEHLI